MSKTQQRISETNQNVQDNQDHQQNPFSMQSILGNSLIQTMMSGNNNTHQATGNTVKRGGQRYTIVQGDTLWNISRRFYGHGRYWQDIKRANPRQCHRGGQLIYAGDELILPMLSVPDQSAPVVENNEREPDQTPAEQPCAAIRVLGPDDGQCAPRDYNSIFDMLTTLSTDDRKEVMLEMRRRAMWDPFINSLQASDTAIVQSWLPAQEGRDGGYTLEERIDQAHNSARGLAALTAVDTIAATDPNRPARITERIRELLGLGVAMSRVAGDDRASEGYLGVHQAERAARALILMPAQEYMRTIMNLSLGGNTQIEQSFVILEAIAARLSRYTDSDRSNDQLQDIDVFADNIRGMNAQTLSDQTTVTQSSTGGNGLVQRYTMSCSPTSALVVRAEADPVEALRLNQNQERNITQLEGSIAAESETALENHGGNTAVARNTSAVTTAVNGAITALSGTAPLVEMTAVSNYMNGVPFSTPAYNRGIIKVRTQIGRAGFPNDQAMRLVRESNIGGSQPGMTPTELQTEWNTTLGVDDVTGQTAAVDWDSTLWSLYTADNNGDGNADLNIPNPLSATWTAPMNAMLNRATPRLENGEDVTFNIYWQNGGGHTMTFTNVRGNGAMRDFLVHDTWQGNTAWVSAASILQANWPGIATTRGLLCGVIG